MSKAMKLTQTCCRADRVLHPPRAVLEADADQIDRIRKSRPEAAGCGTLGLLVEFPIFLPTVYSL